MKEKKIILRAFKDTANNRIIIEPSIRMQMPITLCDDAYKCASYYELNKFLKINIGEQFIHFMYDELQQNVYDNISRSYMSEECKLQATHLAMSAFERYKGSIDIEVSQATSYAGLIQENADLQVEKARLNSETVSAIAQRIAYQKKLKSLLNKCSSKKLRHIKKYLKKIKNEENKTLNDC